MPEGQVLEFSGITKRFGAVTAVEELSARVEPGQVTGFLGPNGAGKTTTLRMLLGLVRPTSGSATIGGEPYAKLRKPLQSVGAVLEASSFHPGRSAANHLNVYAQAAGIARARVDETLDLVGLGDVAGRKVGGYSLGMRQRLGLAYAMLGDPGVLVLDEPSNGLDPEGIRWMRGLLRTLAAEGRTVLISSHLLAEVQQTVDALIIIADGRLVYQGGIEDLADPADYATIVDSPDRDRLIAALDTAGLGYEVLRNGLTVRAAEPVEVGALAASAGIALSVLQRRGAGLEDVFLDLVNGVRTHPSAGGVAAVAAAPAAPESERGVEPEAEPEALSEPEAAHNGGDLHNGGPEAPNPSSELQISSETPATEGEAEPATEAEPAEAEPGEAEPGEAEPEPAEPTTHTASFSVASTGVIDIVSVDDAREPDAAQPDIIVATDAPEPEGGDEAWLAERLPVDPESDAGDIGAPEPDESDVDDNGDGAPQTQPEQPAGLLWAPEPTSAAEHLAEHPEETASDDPADASDRKEDER